MARTPTPNYALRGDIEVTYWAPSDAAALSRAQGIVCDGPPGCFVQLYFLGISLDEPMYSLSRADGVLCTTEVL